MSNKEVIDEVCDKGYRLPKPTIVETPDEIYDLMQRTWSYEPDKRPNFDDLSIDIKKIRVRYGFDRNEIDMPVPRKGDASHNYAEGNQALGGEGPETSNYNSMDLKEGDYKGMDMKDDNYQSEK